MYIELIIGDKWWILPSNIDDNLFARLNIFMNDKFDIDSASAEQWSLEGMLLQPGTRL